LLGVNVPWGTPCARQLWTWPSMPWHALGLTWLTWRATAKCVQFAGTNVQSRCWQPALCRSSLRGQYSPARKTPRCYVQHICPSVRNSPVLCQMAKGIVKIISPLDSYVVLFFQRVALNSSFNKIHDFRQISRCISETVQDVVIVT